MSGRGGKLFRLWILNPGLRTLVITESGFSAVAGPKLVSTDGELAHGDIEVRSIPAQHHEDDEEMGSNHIVIVDWFGMRIVHFGDLDQEELTPEQLEVGGEVDVAITQFDNSWSGIGYYNNLGIVCMEQVGPKIVIPHVFISIELAKIATETWPVWYREGPYVIGPGNLPD